MIHLLFTGGTISMQRDERAGGNVPTHGGEALVARVPGLERLAPYRIDDWGRYPAAHLGPAKLWDLREHVRGVMEGAVTGERPTGIVIAHGTDTIEETAYLLARTLDPGIPVALTGAMRTAGDTEWDGPRNLLDSARVAASSASAHRGAMVVFAGRIYSGLQATKVDTTALDAFQAPHGGPIGSVVAGRVEYAASGMSRPRTIDPSGITARVALVPMVVGDQGEILDLVRPTHDGVVIMAFGSGNLPPGAVPAIHRWLADGKPVVLSSRCLAGQVTGAYAFPGGGGTLLRDGVIPAGARTASQARMELTITLSAGVAYGDGA